MQEPLVSVVVPAFGRPAFLNDAIESVLAQSVQDFEVIIVDDCSPQPLSNPTDDPRVRLVRRNENGGQSAAINTGLEHARGKYVAFLDDDDLYRHDRLAVALEGLKHAPVALCWSNYLGTPPSRGRLLRGQVHDCILDATTPSLGATAILRSACPRLDSTFVASADIEWWLRTSRELEVYTVPEVAHLVRWHDGPRKLNGSPARVRAADRLLTDYADYFAAHPRAKAHRLTRMALMSLKAGQHGDARRYSRQALVARPSLSGLWQYWRCGVGPMSQRFGQGRA